jgi:hypothetical protein
MLCYLGHLSIKQKVILKFQTGLNNLRKCHVIVPLRAGTVPVPGPRGDLYAKPELRLLSQQPGVSPQSPGQRKYKS